MPGQKRSRLTRKLRAENKRRVRMALAERVAPGMDDIAAKAFQEARDERDTALGKLDYPKRIEELYAQWAAERRKVWTYWDERRSTILKGLAKRVERKKAA